MRGRSRLIPLTFSVIMAMAGCASAPAIPVLTDQATQLRHAEEALQAARAEAAALRSDIAAARIAAAKQEAELRELRRRVQDLQAVVEAKHVELVSLQNERDRLAQEATVAHVHVADPAPQTAADEISAMKVKLQELEATLAALAAELARVKGAMRPGSIPPRGEDKR